MNKLISDLRNMVGSSRHTGEPVDTERVAAAIAGYSRPCTHTAPTAEVIDKLRKALENDND